MSLRKATPHEKDLFVAWLVTGLDLLRVRIRMPENVEVIRYMLNRPTKEEFIESVTQGSPVRELLEKFWDGTYQDQEWKLGHIHLGAMEFVNCGSIL